MNKDEYLEVLREAGVKDEEFMDFFWEARPPIANSFTIEEFRKAVKEEGILDMEEMYAMYVRGGKKELPN